MKNSKKKKSYDYTDPYEYGYDDSMEGCHFSDYPDLEDEEEYLDDDGYYDFVNHDPVPVSENLNNQKVYKVSVGDIARIQYRPSERETICLYGLVLKVYDDYRFYVHVINAELCKNLYKLNDFSTWRRYDVYKTGLYVDLKNAYNSTINYDIIDHAKYEQCKILTTKIDEESGKSQTEEHVYHIYTEPMTKVVFVDYKGSYGLIELTAGYNEEQCRKLACYRANLKHRIKTAENLGIGFKLI